MRRNVLLTGLGRVDGNALKGGISGGRSPGTVGGGSPGGGKAVPIITCC